MPDEPAWGQFRRLARENGYYSPEALLKLVPEEGSRDRWSELRRQLAFFMSGTARPGGNRAYDLYDFFRNHCIFPQLVGFKCWVAHWQSWVFRWAFHHGTHYPSTWFVRSCPECAKEDYSEVGFAWYRQGHQLPGADWCLRHGCSLFQVPTGPDLIRCTNWESYQVPFTSGGGQRLPPFVHRYLHTLEWLRRRKDWVAWSELEKEVNGLAFGSENAGFEAECELRARIESVAPQDWYRAHFVESLKKVTRGIDCWEATSSPELALRAAYVTTSDADLDCLMSKTEAGVEAIKETLRRWRRSGGVTTGE